MAFTHLLLGCILASFFLQLQAISTTCTTASTALTKGNITTIADGSFSCNSVANTTGSDDASIEAALNCSMKAIFDRTAEISVVATYLCSITTTNSANLTASSSVAANCSGLYNTSALNATAIDIDGTGSCSFDISSDAHKPPQKGDYNSTLECTTIVTTSAINETVTTTNTSAVCSEVTVIRSGPTVIIESVATANCTSFVTTTITGNHTSTTQTLEVCSSESTITTSPSNATTSDSFFRGSLFPALA